MGKESIGVRIVERSMLAEVLLEIASLDGVPEQSAAIGTVEKVAIPVERQSVNVASAFGEKLQFMGDRVIPPDALLKLESANLGCCGAAVQSVEPAVGAPSEMVRHRLGVLHAKPAQQHLGIAVGNIIAVLVGIEKQIRRLHHEHAAKPELNAGDEIEIADEVLELISVAGAGRVFHDSNAIGALWTAGRRFRHAVINGTGVAVHADALQPRRVGILQILNGPEPSPIVELH